MTARPSSARPHVALAWRPLGRAEGILAAAARLGGARGRWLLDSSLPSARCGRFSFAGAEPFAVLRARGRRLELEVRRAVRPGDAVGRRSFEGDPLEAARALLACTRDAVALDPRVDALPFAAGAVGYFGYELAALYEPLAFRGRDDLDLPDLHLAFVDRLLVEDHTSGEVAAVGAGFGADGAEARRRAEEAAADLARAAAPEGVRDCEAPSAGAAPGPAVARAAGHGASSAPHFGLDERAHAERVDTIRRRIAAGDLYQACLTHRIEVGGAGDPWTLHRALRRASPAPFAALLELPEATLVSSSPERFLRVERDGTVESRPIKGTRPRGKDADEDAAFRLALAASEKDRAENVMIVDLVRNDLGRVCETGSVEVPELCVIEDYATVFQMVSTVRGRLRAECDALDAVRAAFPAGSMTGAPKIAAMRLLDRLEPVRRGPYAGALGWLDLRGGADLSVVIRTALLRHGVAYVQVGGGIVADSEPAAEWRESLDKARALLEALADARA